MLLCTLLILTNLVMVSPRGGSARVRFRWQMLLLPLAFMLACQLLLWRYA